MTKRMLNVLVTVVAALVAEQAALAEQVSEFSVGGSLVNATLINGLNNPLSIAISGNDIFIANEGTKSIGEYDLATGTAINVSLITGLQAPVGLAISGNDLFVSNDDSNGNGTIGEYTTSGATVNAAMITELNTHPKALAISGGDLFIANDSGNFSLNTISEYTTSGSVVNTSLITNISDPWGLAVSGANLYVSSSASFSGGQSHPAGVGEYTTSGSTVNSLLVSGLSFPPSVAVSGGIQFVADQLGGFVGEYDAATGALIRKLPTTGSLMSPPALAVAGGNVYVANSGPGVPEPSSLVLAVVGIALVAMARRKMRFLGKKEIVA